MNLASLLKEALRSGTIAALAMVPFGLLFKFLGLRVGYYGPKLAGLVFGEAPLAVLFVQHLVIGWISALPLLIVLGHSRRFAPPTAVGAAYGVLYYVAINSLALPLLFGDPTPWSLGFSVILPSLLIHIVFGASIGLTAGTFAAIRSRHGLKASWTAHP